MHNLIPRAVGRDQGRESTGPAHSPVTATRGRLKEGIEIVAVESHLGAGSGGGHRNPEHLVRQGHGRRDGKNKGRHVIARARVNIHRGTTQGGKPAAAGVRVAEGRRHIAGRPRIGPEIEGISSRQIGSRHRRRIPIGRGRGNCGGKPTRSSGPGGRHVKARGTLGRHGIQQVKGCGHGSALGQKLGGAQ
jgi:hypothetical protein